MTLELMADKAGFSASRLDWITDHINRRYIEPKKITGCQIMVSRHGYPAYFRSFGLMDRERERPMIDDAIFRIYSMTKPITSVALMQLFERGHFQLNDPVSRFVPGWKEQQVWVSGEGDDMQTKAPDQPMTIRHVLNHSGGLTYGNTDHPVDRAYRALGVGRDQGATIDEFMQKLAQVPLRYEPGERWMYSYSTDVCGGLVEVISGQPFDEYLKENLFEPLNMPDTAFYVARDKKQRFTANYQRNDSKTLDLIDDPIDSPYLLKPSFFSGGGGLTSTTADYHQFCEMLRRGGELDGERILGPRTLEMMQLNHLKYDNDLTQMAIGGFSETAYAGIGFGLGFATTLDQVDAGGLGVGDYYWGGAASTIFWVDPVEDLIVIFMTQMMPSNTFNFRGQLKNIVYAAIE